MRQNKKTMLCIIAVVIALMIALMAGSARLSSRIAEGNTQIEELKKANAAEEKRTEEIRSESEYMQSDAYKEQVAKDKLGLIKDGEIIFRESDTAGTKGNASASSSDDSSSSSSSASSELSLIHI